MWIVFNQGWGQHDTHELVREVKSLDPSRLVVGASGWNDRGVGDVLSLHDYSGAMIPGKDGRAIVYGECGGIGWSIPGHVSLQSPLWSFAQCDNGREFCSAFDRLLNRIVQAREAGISGAVLTQYSDVESEVDGVVSFDRKVVKLGRQFNATNRATPLTRLKALSE
jgi:hypothetical protein